MPTGLMRSLAERYGVSLQRVESAWRECSEAIHPVEDGKAKGKPGYGVVVNCVKSNLRKK